MLFAGSDNPISTSRDRKRKRRRRGGAKGRDAARLELEDDECLGCDKQVRNALRNCLCTIYDIFSGVHLGAYCASD